MSLSTSQLIHFTPDAGGATEAPTPEPRLTLNLATRLDGSTAWNTYAGAGLSTSLTIHFTPEQAIDLCDRLRLTGISPMGHAPLVLEHAAYHGSTACYGGTDSEPLFWYVDEEGEAPSGEAPTLAIGFPISNVWPLFQWPTEGLWAFDPPLKPDEDGAVFYQLELDALEGLNPESDTKGVRLPMRLIAMQPDVTGETEIDALIDLDAPGFSGSHGRVTYSLPDSVQPKRPSGAMWVVTAADLAEKFPDVADKPPITIELYWRIYKGSGDMIYRGRCRERTLDDTYQDRRNAGNGGGSGFFDTTNLHVATITLDRRPYEFLVNNTLNFKADGTSRTVEYDGDWGRPWVSAKGEIVNLRQSKSFGYGDSLSNAVGMGGMTLCYAPAVVVCACLVEAPDVTAEGETKPIITVVRALCQNGTLYHIRPHSGAVVVGQLNEWPSLYYPSRTFTDRYYGSTFTQAEATIVPDLATGCFSQDGLKVMVHAPSSTESGFYPGVVWEATLTVSEDLLTGAPVVTFSEWNVVHQDSGDVEEIENNHPDINDSSSPTENSPCSYSKLRDHSGIEEYDYTLDRLLGAGFDGNNRIVRVARLRCYFKYSHDSVSTMQASCCPYAYEETSESLRVSEEEVSVKLIEYKDGSESVRNNIKIVDYFRLEKYYNDSYKHTFPVAYDGRTEMEYGGCAAMWSYFKKYKIFVDGNESFRSVYDHDQHYRLAYNAVSLPLNSITAAPVSLGTFKYEFDITTHRVFEQQGNDYSNPSTDETTTTVNMDNYEDERFIAPIKPSSEELEYYEQYPRSGKDWFLSNGSWAELTFKPSTPGMYSHMRPGINIKGYAGSTLSMAGMLDTLSHPSRCLLVQHWAATGTHDITLAGVQTKEAEQAVFFMPSGDEVTLDDSFLRATVISPRFICVNHTPTSQPDWSPPNPTAEHLIAEINLYRGRFGLSPVTADDALDAAIEGHVLWMRDHNSLTHTGADDSTPDDRARDEAFAGEVGELIANAAVSADEVIGQWFASTADRTTLDDPRWNRVGVMIVTMGSSIDEKFWWGVLLGEAD